MATIVAFGVTDKEMGREPEPCPWVAGGDGGRRAVEAVEHALALGWVDAEAAVADRDGPRAVGVRAADVDRRPRLRELDRVREQVLHHLLQPEPVAVQGRPGAAAEPQGHPPVGCTRGEVVHQPSHQRHRVEELVVEDEHSGIEP